MSQPQQLYALQQLDSWLDQTTNRLTEIETALSSNAAVQAAQKAADAAKQALQHTQLELKQAEQDVQAQNNKIDNNQRILYSGSVTNPKELEDLQHEAEALKRHLATLEDVQLEKLVTFEDAQAHLEDRDGILETTLQKVANENADLGKEQTKLLSEKSAKEDERSSAIGMLPDDVIGIYDKLRKDRRGVAVAKVENNSCAACGATLTAAQLQAAKSPNHLTHCDSCGRILFAG